MSIDTEDGWRFRTRTSPGRTTRASPTPEIQDGRSWLRRGKSSNDAAHNQVMDRAVEESERRALAPTRHCRASAHLRPALDVNRGQSAQRAGNLGKGQVVKVTRFERCQPPFEARVVVTRD